MVKISVTTNVARLAQRLAEMSDAELERRLNELAPDELDGLREMSSAEYAERSEIPGAEEIGEAERLLADENEDDNG